MFKKKKIKKSVKNKKYLSVSRTTVPEIKTKNKN